MNQPSLEDQYRKLLADHITVSVEDLTANEYLIINKAFILFEHRLNDIKTLEDEVKRLSLELANIKAMNDAFDEHPLDTGDDCPTCGRNINDFEG